jgi:hypothetical protein
VGIIGKELLEELQSLSEEELSHPVYSWGCQQCTHPVSKVDSKDMVANGVKAIVLEIED